MSIPYYISHSTDTAGLQRVRKLLRKAESTDNAHEAEAFSRKAAELVAQLRIDPARIARDDIGELGVRDVPLGRGAYVRARLALLTVVADAHDAKVVFGSTPEGTVAHVAGYLDDLDVIDVLYHGLHAQASSQMATQRRGTPAATQRFRRSFLFGFADRMSVILTESRHAEERESVMAAGSPGAAQRTLALRRRADSVEEFAATAFGRVRSARRPSAAAASGFQAGERAANSADVGRRRLDERRGIGPAAP